MRNTYITVIIIISTVLGLAGGAAAQEESSTATMPTMEHDQSMAGIPMQQNMKRMHEQMQSMMDAKSETERHAMMQEHMSSMQDMMSGHGMMKNVEQRGMALDQASEGSGSDRGMKMHGMMQHRVDGLEQRLNAMQFLVDQILKSRATMLEDD